MSRVVSALLLGSVVGGAVGCGDLSQEDLLFRAAVPPRTVLAVTPPGTSPEDGDADDDGGTVEQALCVDGDLRCNAQEIAQGFNGFTFVLLDVVDAIADLPPTTRQRGRRVWGPHYDLQKDRTFRFEMVREDDGVTFSFCLHAAEGRVADRDVQDEAGGDIDCATANEEAGGLINLLSGSFEPAPLSDGGAREGRGTMHFDAERGARLDGERRFARSLDFVFDNTGGRTDIQIDVAGAPLGPSDDDGESDAAYDFAREADGSGTFSFDVFVDLVDDGGLIPGASQPEHVLLRAAWNAAQAGRATGVVDGGDVDKGSSFSVEQCWDGEPGFVVTYLDDVGDGDLVGDEARCLFNADLTPR